MSERNLHQFLEESSVVSVVVLVVEFLDVDLVSLTGRGQLLKIVEHCRVQRVNVDQTHQVLPVVFIAESGLSWFGLSATR